MSVIFIFSVKVQPYITTRTKKKYWHVNASYKNICHTKPFNLKVTVLYLLSVYVSVNPPKTGFVVSINPPALLFSPRVFIAAVTSI